MRPPLVRPRPRYREAAPMKRLERCMDAAQLVFGCAVLPAIFRAVGHARVQRASHEPAANEGRSFIEEASAADKALFVLKMLGTHRPIGWRREWSRLARHLADEAAKRSVIAEKA